MKRDTLLPSTEPEAQFWHQGRLLVAGVDEVGRGPWAGPVVAAAVILPSDSAATLVLNGVRDSKVLTRRAREHLYGEIVGLAIAVGIGWSTSQEIDACGIVPATRLAMQRALYDLDVTPDALVIDALALPRIEVVQAVFPRADVQSLSVASASIIAKVSRDRWMEQVAEVAYPGYGFASHKGYGSAAHATALRRLGVCDLHRRSFGPIACHCP